MAALEDLASVAGIADDLFLVAFYEHGEPVATCIAGERLVIPV